MDLITPLVRPRVLIPIMPMHSDVEWCTIVQFERRSKINYERTCRPGICRAATNNGLLSKLPRMHHVHPT